MGFFKNLIFLLNLLMVSTSSFAGPATSLAKRSASERLNKAYSIIGSFLDRQLSSDSADEIRDFPEFEDYYSHEGFNHSSVPVENKETFFVESEPIWVTQHVSAPGHLLCQNGEGVFFKDRDSCAQIYPKWRCFTDLRLGYLDTITQIYLGREFVTQYYSVPRTYTETVFKLEKEGYKNNFFKVVSKRQRELAQCYGRNKRPKQINLRRRIVNWKELKVLSTLIENGFDVIETPPGRLHSSDYIYSYSGFTALAEKDVRKRPPIKSPLCNENFDPYPFVEKASGEWTGNGILNPLLPSDLESLGEVAVPLLLLDASMPGIEKEVEVVCAPEVTGA